MNGEITGPLTLETWRLVNIVEGSRTRACMHWESEKKKRNKEERRCAGRKEGGGEGEEEEREARRRRWIANERMGAFETRCKVYHRVPWYTLS